MRAPKFLIATGPALAFSCFALLNFALLNAQPALAYTACNSGGDCWHTDTRVHYPDVKLSFHNDKWADTHKSDTKYHWHDADAEHDAAHGYWNNGEWHHE